MFSFYNKIYYINQEASFSNAIPESLNVRLTCVEKSQLHFIIYYFLSNLEASFFFFYYLYFILLLFSVTEELLSLKQLLNLCADWK